MRFGSVCSGIEAASVAWHPLGWRAAWLSEIEPFPSAVLAHHYPDVPNLGDMTKLPQMIESGDVEAPDLFCGGTPCQAFSVAGLRKSLDDDRGNLSLTFCEIANAIDSARLIRSERPCIVFWENVPGVLNTKDNAFGCFLAGLAGEELPLLPAGGKWTNAGCVLGPKRAVAWRVLDAQYFGVAQRRKRVFVVASARDGFNPASVLFEFQGLRRDTAPSREAGQATTPSSKEGSQSGGSVGIRMIGFGDYQQDETASTIKARDWKDATDLVAQAVEVPDVMCTLRASGAGFDRPGNAVTEHETYIPVHYRKSRRAQSDTDHETWVADDVSNTLNCFDVGDVRATDVVAQPTYCIQGSMIGRNDSAGPQGTGVNVDIAFTQNTIDRHAVAQPVGFDSYNHAVTGDVSKTLDVGQDYHHVPNVFQAVAQPIAPTLTASNDPSRSPQSTEVTNQVAAVHTASMAVRRLAPVECERLQGFPDGYTNIPWRGKPESPDGPRYKALGNSWAVPVVRWIGKRIQEAIK